MSIEAYQKREDSKYLRAGLITSAVINTAFRKPRRLSRPQDFVPRRVVHKEQTPEQQLQVLKRLALVFGGKS